MFPLLNPDLSFEEALESHKLSADKHHLACLVNSGSSKQDLVEMEGKEEGKEEVKEYVSRKQKLIHLQE